MSEHCCRPGMVNGDITVELLSNHGVPCFKVTQPIGSLFGHDVEGELVAYGRTEQDALAHLKIEQDRLYESLWI